MGLEWGEKTRSFTLPRQAGKSIWFLKAPGAGVFVNVNSAHLGGKKNGKKKWGRAIPSDVKNKWHQRKRQGAAVRLPPIWSCTCQGSYGLKWSIKKSVAERLWLTDARAPRDKIIPICTFTRTGRAGVVLRSDSGATHCVWSEAGCRWRR